MPSLSRVKSCRCTRGPHPVFLSKQLICSVGSSAFTWKTEYAEGKVPERQQQSRFDHPPTTSHPGRTQPTKPGRGGAGPGAAWQEEARTFRCRRSRWLHCCLGPWLPVYAPAGCFFPPELIGPSRPYGTDPRRHIL